MKKIPSVFEMDYSTRPPVCTGRVTPGCEWVLNGEGVATAKYDGTALLYSGGQWYQRYDAKRGKVPPTGAIPCDPAPDPITGHWPHWVVITKTSNIIGPFAAALSGPLDNADPATYELCGPGVQGNPHKLPAPMLYRHGSVQFRLSVRTEETIREHLRRWDSYEGIVFHHPDGRMAKVRRDQFGLKWPVGAVTNDRT